MGWLHFHHTHRLITVPPYLQADYSSTILVGWLQFQWFILKNGHYGSSGPLLIRTMSPKSKAMSPNFISGRNIKQAGKCSKGSLFREWINSEREKRQRKLGSFASSKKKGEGGGAQIVFLQHSTLTRHLNLADHKLVILATSLSLREHGSMREKTKTP